MARLALVAICVAAAFSNVRATAPLSYGMSMADKAFGAVCWYETLKIFPNTRVIDYSSCEGGLKGAQGQIENPSQNNKEYFEFYPDKKITTFGTFINSLGTMDSLPNADYYKAACNRYVTDYKAAPLSDESDALNDKNQGKYPYKALAYCLIKALRDKHGKAAITAVKDERTVSVKPWRLAILDRDNEFRARHGSEPFTLNTELSNMAQAWAEENARTCNMHHAPSEERRLNGEYVGENVFGQGSDTSSNAAYQASDMWYEEIKNYPFPGKPHGNGESGHFSQSVWRGSKQVGYGYAYNPECGGYVVGRYLPGGKKTGKNKM